MDLHRADEKGDVAHVRLPMELGKYQDEYDSDGYTPLHKSSWDGNLDVVQYLVEQGATIDKTTHGGCSYTPLSGAAFNGHLDVVRYLLEQGADRDKADGNGDTPLHDAVCCGELEIAMLLMSYGADLNVRNKYGRLPIDLADTEEIEQAIRRAQTPHGSRTQTSNRARPTPQCSYINISISTTGK